MMTLNVLPLGCPVLLETQFVLYKDKENASINSLCRRTKRKRESPYETMKSMDKQNTEM